MAAETGGNCALTRPDEIIQTGGVTILGPPNLPGMVPMDASRFFGGNVRAVLEHIVRGDGTLALDSNDAITGPLLGAHPHRRRCARWRERHHPVRRDEQGHDGPRSDDDERVGEHTGVYVIVPRGARRDVVGERGARDLRPDRPSNNRSVGADGDGLAPRGERWTPTRPRPHTEITASVTSNSNRARLSTEPQG